MSENEKEHEGKSAAGERSAATDVPLGGSELRRDEDFASLYANNVRYEYSLWDLKLIFGQLDQSTGKEFVRQHTEIALPWVVVKLMIYYLELNLATYEAESGKVALNPRILPQEIEPLTADFANNEFAKMVHARAQEIRRRFMTQLAESQPRS